MIANSTFYICFWNKASGPSTGTNKAIEKLGSSVLPGLQVPWWPFKSALKLPQTHFICILGMEMKYWDGSKQTPLQRQIWQRRGVRIHFKCAAANLTTLTPPNGAAGRRLRGLDGRGRCGLGSTALPGSLLSKWNESCQLSKSVRCPPQAWAYQAHWSPAFAFSSACASFYHFPLKAGFWERCRMQIALALWKRTRLYHTRDVHDEGRDHWFIAKSLQKVCNNCSERLHNPTFFSPLLSFPLSLSTQIKATLYFKSITHLRKDV